jgi:hypothetical protein
VAKDNPRYKAQEQLESQFKSAYAKALGAGLNEVVERLTKILENDSEQRPNK